MRLRIAAGIAGSLLALGVAAQNASPERGQKLYMEKMCYTCHGTVGQGGERGTGPRIAPTEWPLEAFAQQVRHPREDMPRYPAKFLSDAEMADLYAYVKSIKRGPSARDIDLLNKAP